MLEKFPNSCKKYKLITQERSGQSPIVLTTSMHHCQWNQAWRWGNWGPDQGKNVEHTCQKSGIQQGKSGWQNGQIPYIRETKKQEAVKHHSLQNSLFYSSSIWKAKKYQKQEIKGKTITNKETQNLTHGYNMTELNQHIKFAQLVYIIKAYSHDTHHLLIQTQIAQMNKWTSIPITIDRIPLTKVNIAFFNHLLCVVATGNALFEKWNALFSTKNSKTTFHLGGCSVLNALNLEKWGVKIHLCAFFLTFLAILHACPYFLQ